jgi:hypothetical protein
MQYMKTEANTRGEFSVPIRSRRTHPRPCKYPLRQTKILQIAYTGRSGGLQARIDRFTPTFRCPP